MPLITQKQVIEELVLLRSEIAANRQKVEVLPRLLRMENQLEALRARLEQEEPGPPSQQKQRGSAGADDVTFRPSPAPHHSSSARISILSPKKYKISISVNTQDHHNQVF